MKSRDADLHNAIYLAKHYLDQVQVLVVANAGDSATPDAAVAEFPPAGKPVEREVVANVEVKVAPPPLEPAKVKETPDRQKCIEEDLYWEQNFPVSKLLEKLRAAELPDAYQDRKEQTILALEVVSRGWADVSVGDLVTVNHISCEVAIRLCQESGSLWHQVRVMHEVFDPVVMGASIQTYGLRAARSKDKEREHRDLKQSVGLLGYRQVARPPVGWKVQLDRLLLRFPHFGEVIDYLRASFSLYLRSPDRRLFEPMLLNGPPSVGKTFFAEEVALIVGAPFQRLNMDTAQSAAGLTGSEEHWHTAVPGTVFSHVIQGTHANPMFLLDEVEKAGTSMGGGGYHDPKSALLELLEPRTARTYADKCYPTLRFDASRVLYAGTCNSTDGLSAALLDRFEEVFDIRALTSTESLVVAQSVMTEERIAARADDLAVDDAVIASLAKLAPRRMQKEARRAIARTLYDERERVLVSDVPRSTSKSGPGFIANG